MRRVVLILMALVGAAGLVVVFYSRPPAAGPAAPPGPRQVWAFEAPRPGSAVAAPLVTPDAVYLAAVHARGFGLSGAVYALDPATGKRKWAFDHDGEMLLTASAPVLADGRLFFGEGMHANFSCRLYCLDPATGKANWTFPTGDHIEGGPAVNGDTVLFPAGNEGVYALDAATGKQRWHFHADLHIDSTPAVAGGRVYVGSGPSRKFHTTQLVCLDAATGKPVWRTPVPLPAWATPVVTGGRVFAGMGNGRLTEGAQPPDVPAGAVGCFDARTGAELWTVRVADAEFGRPVVVDDRVVFGSRDGHLYGLSADGREVFRLPLGGPVIGGPVVSERLVYAVSVPGRVVCVDPAEGRELWRHELARPGGEPRVYAAPRVAGGRLYVAAEMRTPVAAVGVVTLFCFELPAGSSEGGDR